MTNYYLAITIGPIIIMALNFFLREKVVPIFKRIIYRGIDSCIHLIFYSYLLGELGLSSKFDSGWAFWSVIYFSVIGLIIFVPIGIYLRWFKK
jgi:hypothetical protein